MVNIFLLNQMLNRFQRRSKVDASDAHSQEPQA